MALVTRSDWPDLSIEGQTARLATQISSGFLTAGEALDEGAPCYIKVSDGLVYMCNGTAADEAARPVGWTAKSYASGGHPVLWGSGTVIKYDAAGGLTPGRLFIAATAGRLDTAATTGDPATMAAAAYAIDTHNIVVLRLG